MSSARSDNSSPSPTPSGCEPCHNSQVRSIEQSKPTLSEQTRPDEEAMARTPSRPAPSRSGQESRASRSCPVSSRSMSTSTFVSQNSQQNLLPRQLSSDNPPDSPCSGSTRYTGTPATLDTGSSDLPLEDSEFTPSVTYASSETATSSSAFRSLETSQGEQCTGCGRRAVLCRAELPKVTSGLLGYDLFNLERLAGKPLRCARLRVLFQCYVFDQRKTCVVLIGIMLISLHVSLALLEGISLERWSYRRHLYDILVCALLVLPLTAAALFTRSRPKNELEAGISHRLETWPLAKIKWIGLCFFFLIFAEIISYVLIWTPPKRASTGMWLACLASCCVHTMVPFTLFTSLLLVGFMDLTYLVLVSNLAEAATGEIAWQVSSEF